jgi:hypothetical protein
MDRAAPVPNLADACAWLDAWRCEGRGMTIGLNGEVTAWWLPEPALPRTCRAQLERLDADPRLKAAVRVVIHAEALVRATQQHAEAA